MSLLFVKRAVGVASAVVILTSALVLAALGAGLAIARASGLEPVIIASGSMAPQAEPGDLILERPHAGTVDVGRVYTFKTEAGLLTHRVIARGPAPGALVTKGDANAVPDPFVLTEADVVGEPVLILRRVGFVLLGLETTEGRVVALLVVLALGRLFATAVGWAEADGTPRSPRSRRTASRRLRSTGSGPAAPSVPTPG